MDKLKKLYSPHKFSGKSTAVTRIVTVASSSHVSSIVIRETEAKLYFYSVQSTQVFIHESYELPGHIEKLFSIAKEAIRALLDSRDFLGYQLSHAKGNINDAQLEEMASIYLKDIPYNKEELIEKSIILEWLIPDQVDADIIATVFKCEDFQAQEILEQARRKMQLSEFPAYACAELTNQHR